MTTVDFYILASGSQDQIACRLAEKAYSLGHQIYVHTQSAEHAQHLDKLLWTFSDGSFVPHQCYQSGGEHDSPILIGYEEAPDTHREVLINLTGTVPLFFSRFIRVAEVVASDESAKQQGRERFRFYRERGYAMKTHNMGN